MRHLGGDGFEAYSAGSHPAGFVHPIAVECLAHMNVPLGQPRSKSWDEFKEMPMDAVLTLCDSAAAESCPVWPGTPLGAHWSLPDPAYFPGTPQERLEFALRIADRLRTKIQGLVELDWSATPAVLKKNLDFLAEI